VQKLAHLIVCDDKIEFINSFSGLDLGVMLMQSRSKRFVDLKNSKTQFYYWNIKENFFRNVFGLLIFGKVIKYYVYIISLKGHI